jgi:hypothetical protein
MMRLAARLHRSPSINEPFFTTPDEVEHIANTRRIAGVMRGQRWLARADLDAMLAEPVP